MCTGQSCKVTQTHASVGEFTMKILLYFTVAVLVPSTKTLTTGAQRSDFIGKLTKDYRLDLSTQHMKDLTKASPSLLHEKWFQRSFKYTHGCLFYLQSPECWNHNHVNTYDRKISMKTHVKTTEMKGQSSSVTAKFGILLPMQYLCIILVLSFLICEQKL